MVLDENALEAMLARQRAAEQQHRPAGSVRTEGNEEFEVYERSDPAERPAPAPPRPVGTPLRPVEAQPDDFEELPGRQVPTELDVPEAFNAEPEPIAEESWDLTESAPAPEPEATLPDPSLPFHELQEESWELEEAPSEPVVAEPEPVMPEPIPEPMPEFAPEPVPQVAPDAPPRRRPQVWPPIGASRREEEATPAQPFHAAAPGLVDDTPLDAPEPAEEPRTHAPTPHAFPETSVDGTGCRIAIVQALFNQELTEPMTRAAIEKAEAAGAQIARHLQVPGVYDLPLTVQTLARRKDVDAVVVIGVVVQGETNHDQLITFSTAKTLQEISLATETPVGLGIIGPGMTWAQAEERIGNGAHAVDAVLAQWAALRTH